MKIIIQLAIITIIVTAIAVFLQIRHESQTGTTKPKREIKADDLNGYMPQSNYVHSRIIDTVE